MERAKKGEDPLNAFNIFLCFLQLLININRNEALQRKGMKIATFQPIAARKFCLVSYWLTAVIWAFPSGFPILLPRGYPITFGHFPAAFLYPFSSAQWLSNNL
jgi:hypothetical protein